jgi:hypothetical protein
MILITLLTITGIWSLWLVSMLVANKPVRSSIAYLRNQKMLIVIPAHNEERHIHATVSSLVKACEGYHYKIMVIADHCQDSTALEAQKAGATALVRSNQQERGKGAALAWFMSQNRTLIQQYSHLAIVDADTLLPHDFMDNALNALQAQQVDVLQCDYTKITQGKVVYTPMAHSLELSNHVRQSGLSQLTGQALLKGNGMIFKTELILKEGWGSNSIAEDLDFSYHLLIKGYKIGYSASTCCYGDMPEASTEATVQHRRWEGVSTWVPKLLWAACKTLNFKLLFLALDLSVPPMVVLLGIMGFLAPWCWMNGLEAVWALQFMLMGVYLVLTPRWNKVPPPLFKDVYIIVKHIGMKVSIWIHMLIKGSPKHFERTPRTPVSEVKNVS